MSNQVSAWEIFQMGAWEILQVGAIEVAADVASREPCAYSSSAIPASRTQ